jgi:hypothetical protein
MNLGILQESISDKKLDYELIVQTARINESNYDNDKKTLILYILHLKNPTSIA